MVTLVAREQTGATLSFRVLPLSARLANAVTAYGWYLAHTAGPVRLAALYPHPFRNWSVPSVLMGTILLLAITGVAGWQASRRRWLIVGWLWFVGTLVPVIGLAQGGNQAWADRFSYWPHIGLLVAVAWGLRELVERYRPPTFVVRTASVLVLGGLGVLTWVQVRYWRDTVTLWQHALAVTQDNFQAHASLGKLFLNQNRPDEAQAHFAEAVRIQPDSPTWRYSRGVPLLLVGRDAEAAECFREALRLDSNYLDAWHNLGVARLREGRPTLAARCFRRVLEVKPDSPDALAGLGLALWRVGERQEGIERLQAALKGDPQCAEAWHALGLAHLAEGSVEEATEALGRALRSNPRLVRVYSDLGVALGRHGLWGQAVSAHLTAVQMEEEAERFLQEMHGRISAADSLPPLILFQCRLAFALRAAGQHGAAAQIYRLALQRDPQWPQRFAEKARELATAPNVYLRDPHFAFELASQASQAVADPPASLLDALAAAQAALGKFPDAVRTAHEAQSKASAAGEAALAASIRDHLQCYEHGQPAMALTGSGLPGNR
jgi:tetratricopeptide (TPR) repeat protein